MKILAAALVVLLTLSGCLQGNQAHELTNLLKVAPQLMQSTPAGNELPSEKWPPELKAFDPERVYATNEGLYIVTSRSFVNEKGLFIPRSPRFVARPGSDPEYGLVVTGLYSYEIRG